MRNTVPLDTVCPEISSVIANPKYVPYESVFTPVKKSRIALSSALMPLHAAKAFVSLWMAFTPPSGKAACDATPGATISIPLSVFVTVKSSGKADRSMLVSFARIAVALFGIALKTLPAKTSTKSDDKALSATKSNCKRPNSPQAPGKPASGTNENCGHG